MRDINLLSTKKNFENNVFVKVRSSGKLIESKVNIKDDTAIVEILEDEKGISPGQACVFYSKDKIGDKVLGGGWIHKAINKNLST